MDMVKQIKLGRSDESVIQKNCKYFYIIFLKGCVCVCAQLYMTLSGTMDCSPPGLCPWHLPSKILREVPFPTQEIFLTVDRNPHL